MNLSFSVVNSPSDPTGPLNVKSDFEGPSNVRSSFSVVSLPLSSTNFPLSESLYVLFLQGGSPGRVVGLSEEVSLCKRGICCGGYNNVNVGV